MVVGDVAASYFVVRGLMGQVFARHASGVEYAVRPVDEGAAETAEPPANPTLKKERDCKCLNEDHSQCELRMGMISGGASGEIKRYQEEKMRKERTETDLEYSGRKVVEKKHAGKL